VYKRGTHAYTFSAISFTVFLCLCVSVGHAVNEIDELWQQIGPISPISYTGFQKGTKLGSLIKEALLYVITQTGELWYMGSPWGTKILKGVKMLQRFLANVNSCSRSLYAVARPSVICLSVCRLSVTLLRPT